MEDFKQKLDASDLSPKTAYIYLNEAKKYLKDNDDLDRWSNEKIILAYIHAHYETLNQKNQMAKTVIKWRKLNGLSIEYLSEYLTKNVSEYNGSLTKKYETEDNDLPSVADYEKYVDGLFAKKQYKSFIINRLIQKFQVRNMDLDLTITRDKQDVDTTKNWLLVKLIVNAGKICASITYTRNNYKTGDVYGTKINKLTVKRSDPLYEAISKVLESSNHHLITDTNIGRAVKSATNGLGEGKVFKILMKGASFKEAKIYSKNRGTDLGTISKSYDVK